MARYATRMQRHKDKERKNIIIAILFLASIFMTLGYAAYQRDLIIKTVGKIYSDWDVRFTDSECELFTEFDGYECQAYGTLITGADHLGKYDAGIVDSGDDLGGVVLHLYTEFASSSDYTEFKIEITNYSEMWNALLTNINYNAAMGKSAGDYILYDIDTLVVDDGSQSVGTVLSTYNDLTKNRVTFTVTAYWNPDLLDSKPDGTLEKSEETTLDETYKEEKQIVLTWEAISP